MERLKPWFIPIYMPLNMLAVVHSFWTVLASGNWLWLAALAANLPFLVFMGWLMASGKARTSASLPAVWVPAVAFGLLSLTAVGIPGDSARWLVPFYGAIVGAGGIVAYIFWYSRLGRGPSAQLQVGQEMPNVSFEDTTGSTITTESLRGKPTIYLFYRGNWCPLCMAQIKEVSERYQALKRMGVQVALISPQSQDHTRELAARFDVDFLFLTDPGYLAAKQLGILHPDGLPKGMDKMLGYDKDTVMPTVVITDAENRIIFADLTDNYRVRPDPDVFMSVLEGRLA